MPERAIAVVIPCRDAADTLPEQLQALAEQVASPRFTVFVVDNRSAHPLDAVVARAPETLDVALVRADDADGVSYARNVGIRAAWDSASKVLICDADDRVGPHWVEGLSRVLEEHDLATGPRVVHPDQQAHKSARELPSVSPPVSGRFKPYAVGSNFGARREVFEDCGFFDEDLIGGGDDIDFSWRALGAGKTLGFAPQAVVEYRLRTTSRQVRRQARAYFRGGRRVARRYADSGAMPQDRRWVLRTTLAVVLRCWWVLLPGRRLRWHRRAGALAGVLDDMRRARRAVSRPRT